MAQYLVQLDHAAQNQVMFNGVDTVVVEAADATEAREMAASQFSGDSDAVWAAATATLIVVDPDFEGWTFRVKVTAPAGADLHDVSYVGVAADDIDEVGAALAALFVTAGLTATYTDATQVLEIADIADGIGDHEVTFSVIPPGGFTPGVTSMVASHVDEGIAAAILSMTFVADAPAIPKVTALLKATS